MLSERDSYIVIGVTALLLVALIPAFRIAALKRHLTDEQRLALKKARGFDLPFFIFMFLSPVTLTLSREGAGAMTYPYALLLIGMFVYLLWWSRRTFYRLRSVADHVDERVVRAEQHSLIAMVVVCVILIYTQGEFLLRYGGFSKQYCPQQKIAPLPEGVV